MAGALQSAGSSDSGPMDVKEKVKSLLQPDTTLPFYTYAVKVLPDRDAIEEADKLWSTALFKWQQVFEILDFPGPLGSALLQEQVTSPPGVDSVVLRDSLGIKSPRTAYKRAQTLLQYFSWLQSTFMDWFPWDRNRCLQYLGVGNSSRPSAYKGMTLLEAFRFARFVLEIPIPENLLRDPQLRGRAQRLLAEKPGYKPARPLKVSELALLERSMDAGLDMIDVYFLGAIIFAVLSRSRWSDLKFLQCIWIERTEFDGELYGFLEARTKHHKTATSLAKKQRFMPLVAPLLGVTGIDWTKHWIAAMTVLGISLDDEPFGALCRAPDSEGLLGRRSCSTEEVGTFLNKILQTNSETMVTSHSLKHTTLAWCAAYGLEEPVRTLLGHHELQGAKAMTVYSRDMLTRPLQHYCSMLENIRKDHFRPDESRTTRMVDLLKLSKVQDAADKVVGGPFADALHEKAAGESAASEPPGSPSFAGESNNQGDENHEEDSSEIPSTGSSSSSSSSEGEDGAASNPALHIEGPVWRHSESCCAQMQ